jgi:3-oxoacyl-[acyl-carrier protein] reductase
MSKKIAIITGASRLEGIGAAVASGLAEEGFAIFLTAWTPYDNDQERTETKDSKREVQILKEQIQTEGVQCEFMELDLMEEGAVVKLLDTVEDLLGAPSVLINNATYSVETTVETLNESELDLHYKLNMKATSLLSTEFIKRFNGLENEGRIINMTSGQSQGPMPTELAYAMTKAAIEVFTTSIESVAAKKGITVNAVNPGPTDTGWMTQKLKEDLLKGFPLGRIGQPKDAANLIRFLCSEQGQWVTGQILHSEGGFQR